MISDVDKLLREADKLAKARGLELVVHYNITEDGGMRLNFEKPDSFKSLVSVVHYPRRMTSDTFAKVQEALKDIELVRLPSARDPGKLHG